MSPITGTQADIPAVSGQAPKLLDQLRDSARCYGHTDAWAAEAADWCRQFVLFHGKRHPKEMGLAEIGRFLEQLAKTDKDALGALAAARGALAFLYERVLHRELGELPLPRPPRLLDQVKQVMRVKHYAVRTEECYVQWIRRFIFFNGTRHPRDMGATELELFLTDLAVRGQVAEWKNDSHKPICFKQLSAAPNSPTASRSIKRMAERMARCQKKGADEPIGPSAPGGRDNP